MLVALRRNRFTRTDTTADLTQMIETMRQELAATPIGDPGRAGMLAEIGYSLRNRFEREARESDLEAGIDFIEQAVAITPEGADRADRLSNLGKYAAGPLPATPGPS